MKYTNSQLAWNGAGKPPPNDKYLISSYRGLCATCGIDVDGDAVSISEIDNATFSNHADFFKFGNSHVCLACAWMYGAGKGKPGNYIATPTSYEQTVISLESVVEDKRPWLTVIKEIANLPQDTPVTGVLTTDVKIRLWPRARVCTVGNFGIYVHCPDYDVSEYLEFDIADLIKAVDRIVPALALGFAKASVWYGLMRDYQRTSKDPLRAMQLESEFVAMRSQPYFLPAVLMVGVTKEEKSKHGTKPITANDTITIPATAGRDSGNQTQFGLF